jgi:hypothetical protein
MEFGGGRNSSDPIAAKLRKLSTLSRVYIDKAVHVANTESLNAILRAQLPLRSQSKKNRQPDKWCCNAMLATANADKQGKTYIVTQRPVWLLCGTIDEGFISASVNSVPTPQSAHLLKS